MNNPHQFFRYLYNNHYCVITRLAAFTGSNYFCDVCNKGYTRKTTHARCGHRCTACYVVGQCVDGVKQKCDMCNRTFCNAQCFANHLALPSPVCANVQKCKTCDVLWKKNYGKHECGKHECRICRQMVDNDHLCYIQPLKPKKEKATAVIVFDFECTQDLPMGEHKFKHRVNLAMSHKYCPICQADADALCNKCGPRNQQFFGDDALDRFCDYLFKPVNRNSVVLCHNMRGYGGCLSFLMISHLQMATG